MNKYEFAYLKANGETDLFYVEANNINDIVVDIGYINECSIYEIECEYCIFKDQGCMRLYCPTWTGEVNELSK